jgi:metal-responsive CopG/Arc/MetJ family transcriptional regulator
MDTSNKRVPLSVRIDKDLLDRANKQKENRGMEDLSDYIRYAIKLCVERDEGKVNEENSEYIRRDTLRHELKQLLKDPKFKEEVFRD